MSACLLGVNCRYTGDGKRLEGLERLMEVAEIIPVCPEVMGGLTTPRTPAERVGDKVIAKDGTDVTAQYHRGAQESLYLAHLFSAEYALMKERSPSCGYGVIYDGTFTGSFKPGNGTASELLSENGIKIYGESRFEELIDELKRR
ncbi:MAG: DUF523 domain-containing protein [Clostridia bacterium]|nr:DUF523 domain-containing protein [Clostridia bacterium]